MKLSTLLFLFVPGLLLTASASETVFRSDFARQKWLTAPAWTIRGNTATATQEPGKWPAAATAVPLEADTFYECTFRYKTSGPTAPDDEISLNLHTKYQFAYPPSADWTTAKAFFYSKEASKGNLTIRLSGKSPFRVEVKDIELKKLASTDLERIQIDFEQDGGPAPAFFRKHDWKNAAGRLELADAEDHVEGGKAMKIEYQAKAGTRTGLAVYSHVLPVEPEKKYRLSFWGKAETQTPLSFGVDGYVHGQSKHWYAHRQIGLSSQWKKYSLEFTGPSLAVHPQMEKRTAYLNFSFPATENSNALFLKSVTLEQIGN